MNSVVHTASVNCRHYVFWFEDNVWRKSKAFDTHNEANLAAQAKCNELHARLRLK